VKDVIPLKVVTLQESNFRDPVKTLRVIADEIEQGKFGGVGCCAVVLLGDTLEVFGMGQDAEPGSVHLVLHAGAARLMDTIKDHGR
jgi:hypothetical protein